MRRPRMASIFVARLAHYFSFCCFPILVRRRYIRAIYCEGIAHWDGGDDYFSQILIDYIDEETPE